MKIKRIFKFVFMFVTIFITIFAISAMNFAVFGNDGSIANGSVIQTFWDEQVKPKLIDAIFDSAVLTTIIAIFIAWIRKKTKKLEHVGKEYGITNKQILDLTYLIEKIVNGKLNDYIDEFKNALKGFQIQTNK